MDILSEILAYKRKEIIDKQKVHSTTDLEKGIYFNHTPISLRKYLQRKDKSGIIAEIKRKSPSKGTLNRSVSVENTSIGYTQAGASGLSIVTDTKYFGGNLRDLQIARDFNFCPILRKDFIIDEYQVVESKAAGADAILLIAAALPKKRLKALGGLAKKLGMEVLLEVHTETDLETKLTEKVDLIGVNNRNLKTFNTNIETSIIMAEKIPSNFQKISESGIFHAKDVKLLKQYGYSGFIIGEAFMTHEKPEEAAKTFIQSL